MKSNSRVAGRVLLVSLTLGVLILGVWLLAKHAALPDVGSNDGREAVTGVDAPARLAAATTHGVIDVRAAPTLGWRVVVRDSRAPAGSSEPLLTSEGIGARRIEMPRLVPSASYVIDVAVYHGAHRRVIHEASANPKKNEVVVDLAAGWSLLCTVETPDGKPLARIPVILTAPADSAPPDGWSPSESIKTATDEQGQAEIPDLLPGGSLDLACVAESYQVHRARLAGAASGERIKHRIILTPAGRLVGRLLLPGGEPARGVGLTVEGIAREEAGSVEWRLDAELGTDAQGRFECDCLSPGEKKVVGTPIYKRGQTTFVQFSATIAVGQTTDVGDVVIGQGAIELQFETPEGALPREIRVRAVLVPASAEGLPVAASSVVLCYVYADEKGTASLRGLPSGHLDLLCLSGETRGKRSPTRVMREYNGFLRETVRLAPLVIPPDAEVGLVAKTPKPGAILVVFDDKRILSAHTLHRSDEAFPSDPGIGGTGIAGRLTILYINDGRFARERISPEDVRTRKVELEASEVGGEVQVQAPPSLGSGRPAILLGLPGQQIDEFVTIGFTDDGGHFQLRGLPLDTDWQIGARLGLKTTRPETVRFTGGVTTIRLAE